MGKGIYVVDCRYCEAITGAFGEAGIFLPSVFCTSLSEPVSCHPDMVLYPAGDHTVVCAPSVFEQYERLLSPFGVNLVQGEKELKKDYPDDVAYNVLNVADCAFSLWEQVDSKIKEFLDEKNIRRLTVAQGYSRCSALAVGRTVITADPSIAESAGLAGLSVLKISPGHICLPGYDYGFIGGASGILSEKRVAFFGGLDTHPDGESIRQAVESEGFSCWDLPGQPLVDVGTILCINY